LLSDRLPHCTFHTTVRDLGVTFDSALTFSQHISNLTRSSYFQLRRLRTIRKAVSVPIFTSIVHVFVCSRIDYCNSLMIGLPKPPRFKATLQTVLNVAARLIARLSRYSHIHVSSYIKGNLHWLPISTRIEYKVLLIVLRLKWGWHIHISVTPSDFRPLPHPFVLYAPLIGGRSLALGLGQIWLDLHVDPFRLLAILFGIAFQHQLVVLSYHPIFLLHYHFLNLVSFLGVNRTKSASAGPRPVRGAI